ncbi:MAG: hypothetical protein NXI03_10915 [Alphaproteobacteria bacterium]|uniref:DUF6544 family protein n=1 Tax=Alexandriicola marinus TaxID=2081710 RepID=UPI000FD93B33|nr:DUF6544 family protein [Alexandriicola marinus]MBM1221434.1 hypothetical protein [Ponticoccus sp. SC6-9]MBM1226475.1 hypothetical protein [Ponticoccus sp. SC6-15]MBM1230426.1 hypothetical protein [Ponticoccus sp. SC6-38]MBM1234949.1 hypothetical protein [Ponticoccus sp. SC6-45]MBM1239447.1 hypothetical protein [Ponticoccus sp. SC6-49]MBM1243229.1 hypothetical protein [Ponticoccus sp. SC2-64]MBM1248473.1 hypothetical protein [Ponticoccus sp. SC6-42]MBM1253058.1 hypothetical protein [Ponti
MNLVTLILAILAAGLLALFVLRGLDQRAMTAEWARLAAHQPSEPLRYSPDMVADLPEPARRYFAYTIQPGTPLYTVVTIEMTGQFSLGTKEAPNYQPMMARQILAAPYGFVWAMRTTGKMPFSGSDSGHWTRFGIFGLIPVARQGGDPDHARSAFGRYVSEAIFWTPAALLPGPGVTWAAVDANTARVTVRQGGQEQAVDIILDPEGRPTEVSFQRWTNANPEKEHRLQPFGGYLSDFREVDGFRLPFHVEAGNMFGTEEYFPFFIAEVTGVGFPAPDP